MWELKAQGPSRIWKLWSVAGKVWRLLVTSQGFPACTEHLPPPLLSSCPGHPAGASCLVHILPSQPVA